ncbi:MAG TPA: 16S rRNA (cytosine(1402)-N(4))-methyltransferase RsmH [Halothiobacillus sp.]|nr:16S rRNA (cytosine(1402)-N(4))-methyltransferase RsmH [Halothiobacillus sp.]
MSQSTSKHITVMKEEAVAALAIDPSGIYVDGTFGRGGHSRAILEQLGEQGRLIAFDRDPAAIAAGYELAKVDPRFTLVPQPFSSMPKWLAEQGLVGSVNGILLDLGVSSPQLDEAERGFSFMQDGPLDMRMDPTSGESAAEWLAHVKLDELTRVLREFGEERHARRIARHIVATRDERPLTRTLELAQRITEALPTRDRRKHPATRCFQAIRIHINRELDELQTLLESVVELLAIGGRLVVISFHSLEDRIVKQFIRRHSECERDVFGQPVGIAPLRRQGKAQRPTESEVRNNPRSRSAVMRCAERVA